MMLSAWLRGRLVLANTFSPNMLPLNRRVVHSVQFLELSLRSAKRLVEIAKEHGIPIESVVGHEGTARIMSELLDIEVPVNRVQYTMSHEDTLLVLTLGFRPPEGKVYSYEELEQLHKEGKLKFIVAVRRTDEWIPPVLPPL